MDNKKCGRPHCKNVEYRIDGYCSIYCRDVHDLETALEAAQAELAGRKESNKRYHKQMCDKEDERRITRKRLDETEKQLAASQDLAVETEHQHQSEISNLETKIKRVRRDNQQ